MTAEMELLLDCESGFCEIRETDAETKYLVLCGARWVNHRDPSAAAELIAALDSAEAHLALIAGALLTEGCACA